MNNAIIFPKWFYNVWSGMQFTLQNVVKIYEIIA